jgi:hypothetical protein
MFEAFVRRLSLWAGAKSDAFRAQFFGGMLCRA